MLLLRNMLIIVYLYIYFCSSNITVITETLFHFNPINDESELNIPHYESENESDVIPSLLQ